VARARAGIYQMLAVRSTILMNTERGLFEMRSWAVGSGSPDWRLAIDTYCVDKIFTPAQVSSTDDDYNSLLFAAVRVPDSTAGSVAGGAPAAHTVALYSIRGTAERFEEVIDSAGKRLQDLLQAPAGATIVGTECLLSSKRTYLVLVSEGADPKEPEMGRLVLLRFSEDEEEYYSSSGNESGRMWVPSTGSRWSKVIRMARYTPSRDAALIGELFMPEHYPLAGRELRLTSLTATHVPMNDMYMAGSAVLYSTTGELWHLIAIFDADETAVQVSSTSDGLVVFVTDKGRVWVTESATLYFFLLPMIPTVKIHAVFFNVFDTLISVTYGMRGDPALPYVESLLPDRTLVFPSLRESILAAQITSDEPCSFDSLEFTGSYDPFYTRKVVPDWQLQSGLPTEVYLDYGQQYSFQVSLHYTDEAGSSNIRFALTQSRTDFVQVDTVRTENQDTNMIVLHIRLSDRRLMVGQYPPGEMLRLTTIYFSVITSAGSCSHVGGRDVALHAVLRVYSGCAPGRHVVYDSDASNTSDSDFCTDGWACQYYPNVYSPQFKLVDEVTGMDGLFSGSYFADIISAGTTRDKYRHPASTACRSVWKILCGNLC
jgi:hypothetical protein